ncbi:ABC transporter substrate-binding protein [Acrocarpospora catenulata]|uniref:ABC transporter substrate-binding protein n=1 Tax=Acrocarpospora catenulata TaxID=2836182 RepID=UPI001BDAF605|nr:ABC transporter substrate-binding protein [Acrocarpospora catenulata]
MPSLPRRLALASLAILTAATALTGCGESAPTGTGGGTPRTGGAVTYAIAGYPVSIDISLQGGRGTLAGVQIVDTLTESVPKTNEIKPRLAKSWTVSPDAKKFTFTLRDDVTFSDGTKFDAQNVKDNLDTLVQLNAAAKTDTLVRSALASYKGSTVIDANTVEVEFNSPELGFLRNLSDPYLGLLSSATLKATPEERAAGKLVGTGPFVLGTIKRNESIELLARKDYNWAPESTSAHQGRAYLDSVTFKVVPESGVRAGLLASQQAELVDDVAKDDEATVTSAGGSIAFAGTPGLVGGLRQNPYSVFGGDKAIRQAVTKSIDRAEVRTTLQSEASSQPVTSAIGATTPLWTDLSADLAYDPEGAKKILEDAGWKAGADGIREKDGVRLDLKLIYTLNSLVATKSDLELLQDQLKRVGIGVTLVPATAAEFTEAILAIKERGTDAQYDFLSGSGPSKDPSFLVGLFRNSNPALGGAEQPELEAAADKLAAATTEQERASSAADLQRLLVSDGYWIPIKELSKVVGASSGLQGFRLDAYALPVLYDTWLDR